MTSPVNTVIAGKYRVKRLLGQGGMGAVYEGVHLEIGKRVAIKVIEPSHAGSAEIAARFKQEARAASAVESDCVVQVFDVGQDPVVGLYMVMEFLTGEDLSVRIEREKRLDPALAVQITLQAARALAKAHAAGVVHRDLKPANLFLTEREDGSVLVKVLDFGISKLMRDSASAAPKDGPRALTRAGTVIGTAQYMSPEQAQGVAIDHRTDVWSLGAVLYEALAGQTAYPVMPTYELTIIQIVTKRPTPLREVASWVPEGLARLVHEAMTPELEQRMPDCGTFARRLTELLPEVVERPSSLALAAGGLQDRPVVVHSPGQSPLAASVLGRAATAEHLLLPEKPTTDEGVAVRAFLGPRTSTGTIAGLGLLAAMLAGGAVLGVRALRHVDPQPGGLVQVDMSPPSAPTPTVPSPVAAPPPPPAPEPVASGSAPLPTAAPAPAKSAHSSVPRTVKAPVSGKPEPAPKSPGQIGGVGVETTY